MDDDDASAGTEVVFKKGGKRRRQRAKEEDGGRRKEGERKIIAREVSKNKGKEAGRGKGWEGRMVNEDSGGREKGRNSRIRYSKSITVQQKFMI